MFIFVYSVITAFPLKEETMPFQIFDDVPALKRHVQAAFLSQAVQVVRLCQDVYLSASL